MPRQNCDSRRGLRNHGFVSYNRAVITLCPRVPCTIVATFMVASVNLFYFMTEASKKPVGSLLLQLS